MSLVLDAAPLVALASRDDPRKPNILSLLRAEPGALIVPAAVTAEIDYLLDRRFGPSARRAFLADLAAGRYLVDHLDLTDYETVAEFDRGYADLNLGLADVSLVIAARRYETRRILTFDHRHFRALRPLQGGTFVLLPDDETEG